LYDCGESLPFANGYPMSFAPPEARFQVFPNFIYDPNQASTIPAQYKPEDHTPAKAVVAVKKSGGICVKTYFERGFGRDKNLPVMSLDVLAAVREAATQTGLVLMMHANSFEAQKFAVDGHVDVIAHGMWNWGDLDKQTDLPPKIVRVLDQIAEEKIGYQSTLQVMQGLRAYFDPEYLKVKAIPKIIPAEMLEWFESPEGKWFKKEISEDNAPDAAMREEFDLGPIRRVAPGGCLPGKQGCQLPLWHGYSFGTYLWKSAGLERLSGDAATSKGRIVSRTDFQSRHDQ